MKILKVLKRNVNFVFDRIEKCDILQSETYVKYTKETLKIQLKELNNFEGLIIINKFFYIQNYNGLRIIVEYYLKK